jgi:enediyne biosynthesis protein CalE5
VAQGIDPVEFRGTQQQLWNKIAPGWDKWRDLWEAGTGPISDRLVELAGVDSGSRVLDIGSGYGEPALTAAKVAGPEGRVTATDISSQMLDLARARAHDAGATNMEIVEGVPHTLDFEPDSFDAAVSRFGIIFDRDGEGAAERVRGWMRSGGRFAISGWGPPDRTPFLGIPIRTVIDRLGVSPPPPGTPGPMSRPTAEALGGLLEGGGFGDVNVEEVEVTFEWNSPEDFSTFIREIAPPVTALMGDISDDEKEATWAEITDRVRADAGEGGRIVQKNQAWLAVGTA